MRGFDLYQRFLVELFGVDDGGIDVGEDHEFIGDPDVVAVGGDSVGDDSLADLFFGKRLDHVVF